MSAEPVSKHASARAVFRTLWLHTRPYAWLAMVVLGAGIALQAANLAAPIFLRRFFNLLATGDTSDATIAALVSVLALTALMWLLDIISSRLQHFCNMYLEVRVMTDLFDHAFKYLMGHSYNYFTSNFAGSLTHRVTKFARSYEPLFDTVMLQFIPTFLFVLGAVVVLSMQHIVLGLILGVWSVCFLMFQIFVSKWQQPLRRARSEADTKVTGSLADAISNHTTVELFSGRAFEYGMFSSVVEMWRRATLRSWFADAWIWAGIGLFVVAVEVALLYGGIVFWQRGLITIGDFVLIQAYLMTTFERLAGINRDLRRFFNAYADASDMVYTLETPQEIQDKEGAAPLAVTHGGVAFRDVSFAFGETQILKNFDLDIKPHEKVALVGPSGAGKSTITKLLLRLYDIHEGRIEIDRQDIGEVTQASLRDAVSYVPQEPVLFHRSLRENIAYGKRDATDDEIIAAAQKAHCHEFISRLPEGYGTFVGERGVKLSGGERQRVAIARAILKDAPILLLDEATSSLDSESEALIQDALKELMKGKTVIVIAHRLSTIMKMDRICVVEKGRIAAEGSHEDLLKGGGLYHKLWNIQAGGFVVDEEPLPIDIETDEEDTDTEQRPHLPRM
jgi:ATP-binding cassette subfamily B protein